MYQNFDFLFVEITIFQFLEEKIVETYQNWGVPVQYSSLSTLKNPQTIKKKVEMYPNLVFKGKNWTKFWFSASRGQHFPVSKGKIIEMYQNAGVPVQYSSLPTVKKKNPEKRSEIDMIPAMSCCALEMVELEPMDLWRMCCILGARAPKRCGGRPRASSSACSRPISLSSLSESPPPPPPLPAPSSSPWWPAARFSSPGAPSAAPLTLFPLPPPVHHHPNRQLL